MILKRSIIKIGFILIFLCHFSFFGQGVFHLPPGEKSLKIPVEVINNLIIVPLTINGSEFSFLLDTGVKSNVLFSIDENEDFKLNDAVTIYLTGAGDGDPIEAIKSQHNIINIGEASAINQNIYFITDASHNFSPRLGHAVNGIIGYSLFKDFVVEVNYSREYIELFKPQAYKYRKCRACYSGDLNFIAGKPYMNITVENHEKILPVHVLIDSGSGDALWLFEQSDDDIAVGDKYFEDFLGLGLNGNVTGKRAKLNALKIGDIELNDVTVAYPDTLSVRNMRLHPDRNGSLGAEVLRRFSVIFDYPGKKITLKKNRDFDAPFRYNRSGLVVQHSGYDMVKELANDIGLSFDFSDSKPNEGTTVYKATNTIQFKLKPNYEIAEIRKGSPGAEAGLARGDRILSVNGRKTSNLELEDITKHFFKDDGSILRLKIERRGVVFNCKFALRKIL